MFDFLSIDAVKYVPLLSRDNRGLPVYGDEKEIVGRKEVTRGYTRVERSVSGSGSVSVNEVKDVPTFKTLEREITEGGILDGKVITGVTEYKDVVGNYLYTHITVGEEVE